MTTTVKPRLTTRTKVLGGISLAVGALAVLFFVVTVVSQNGGMLGPVVMALIALSAGSMWLRERRLATDTATERPPLAKQSAWPAFLRTANFYERILCLGGAGAILLGGIIGLAASGAGRNEREANDLLVVLGGFEYYDSSAGTHFLGWMWFGIILVILGAVSLVIFVAIRAAASSKAE